ncbi:hypothetical protein VCRA2120E57_40121 [Vibrio crassostreae]|nr:hypothetical protein VCRA2120E57_40121 [Vibrio crassostreae]
MILCNRTGSIHSVFYETKFETLLITSDCQMGAIKQIHYTCKLSNQVIDKN